MARKKCEYFLKGAFFAQTILKFRYSVLKWPKILGGFIIQTFLTIFLKKSRVFQKSLMAGGLIRPSFQRDVSNTQMAKHNAKLQKAAILQLSRQVHRKFSQIEIGRQHTFP